MSKQECPNGCGKLVSDRKKDVEFEDLDGNAIRLTIQAIWCPKCLYREVYDV